MDGVIDIDRARELVGNAALWPRVRDFLWDFAPQVHESWLGGLGMSSDKAVDGVAAQPLGRLDMASPRVKAWVLRELGVEPCFHDFPKEDGSRLLLLDGAILLEIAKWLGAIASAGVLRRVTDGATVRSLKAALHGVYPEVFGYTAYFKNMEKLGGTVADLARGTDGSGKLGAEFVVAVGHGLLDDALSRLPTPLLKRFRLKLPKDLPPRPSDHLTTQSLNLQLLMKLRFPEAYALCSS